MSVDNFNTKYECYCNILSNGGNYTLAFQYLRSVTMHSVGHFGHVAWVVRLRACIVCLLAHLRLSIDFPTHTLNLLSILHIGRSRPCPAGKCSASWIWSITIWSTAGYLYGLARGDLLGYLYTSKNYPLILISIYANSWRIKYFVCPFRV